MGGKKFHGSKSFVETRNQLQDTESVFDLFELDDRRKVQLAAWKLKDEASYWWEGTQAERPVATWNVFRRRFEMWFLSRAEGCMQMERFLGLRQGDMSIKEYVKKFNQLARFGLDLVNTPYKKALSLREGLINLSKDLHYHIYRWRQLSGGLLT